MVKQSFIDNKVVDENLLANANLVNSLIHQESRGKSNAVSRDGAIGLMQILPETAINPGLSLEGMEGTREVEVIVVLSQRNQVS